MSAGVSKVERGLKKVRGCSVLASRFHLLELLAIARALHGVWLGIYDRTVVMRVNAIIAASLLMAVRPLYEASAVFGFLLTESDHCGSSHLHLLCRMSYNNVYCRAIYNYVFSRKSTLYS
jgi:hypothetical protein